MTNKKMEDYVYIIIIYGSFRLKNPNINQKINDKLGLTYNMMNDIMLTISPFHL